jgi:hypothetical protein
MESEEMKEIPPIGQDRRCRKGLGKSLGGSQWFPRDKNTCKECCTFPRHKNKPAYMYNVRWTRKLILLSLIAEVNNNVYQQKYKY